MEKIKDEENEFLPVVAIPPGETIKEYLEALTMTQKELALRLDITLKHLNNILNDNAPITYETAVKLESVIGPSANFWMNLEQNYQLDKARIEERQRFKEDYEILKKIPYTDISKLGWLEATRDKDERVKNCRKYYQVANLGLIQNSHSVAFRLSKVKANISDYGVLAWLKKAEERGMSISVSSFDKQKLKSLIPRFRELTMEKPEVFYVEMRRLCSECGVALVLVESVPKTYINGATIWKGDKVILALSVRGKKADIFWFTFFHELAHLIKHSRKEFHIDFEKDEEEEEADQSARNYLIDDKLYDDFVHHYDYTNPDIITKYAYKINIAPCILIGRLQHDKLIPYNQIYERLRPSFIIISEKSRSKHEMNI